MQRMIYNDDISESVINISAEIKMVQNNKNIFEQPLYELDAELKRIDLDLKHS